MDMGLVKFSSFLESCSMNGVGSAPMLKKQTMGVKGLLSLCMTSMFRMTASANFGPNELARYFLLWVTVRSGDHALKF